MYRHAEHQDRQPDVLSQMRGACEILRTWRKFNPVISGGALWAWSAGEMARDVDIFVKSTWRTRRKSVRMYGPWNEQSMVEKTLTSYSYHLGLVEESTEATVRVHCTSIPETDTHVDLILHPWEGAEVISHFDYKHCAVAFGPRSLSSFGAKYYASGDIVCLHSREVRRHPEVIKRKLQPKLWGKDIAPTMLNSTFSLLSRMYSDLA